MPGHRHRTLRPLAAALIALAACTAPVAGAPVVEHVGTHVWTSDMEDPDFGGFSGIEISADGASFHAISDRAWIYWGSIQRDNAGRIRGLSLAGRAHLKDSRGSELPPGRLGDSEGLAIADDGTIWITFEGLDRLAAYDTPDSPARRIPRPPVLAELQVNSGMEALAIAGDGTLLAVPERSGQQTRPYPVLRYDPEAQVWDVPFQIERQGRWLPTGADFGPDGMLYLLERDFRGVLGFQSRVRRFDISDATTDTILTGEELLSTSPLQYDNLEGISVWDDGLGLRITMISDDNFLFVQRTELVEYRVRE
ncbi:esterase-like activity of phytase family protein (plasmid) [Paracoccus sp. TK19116]|uniref:Esterase-like activity of phytase family protein n=1 Tax=Paracoccus albicereus TaxID=2922394 RepID=A0ABT1MMI4_9RHOB|nr:esterase-like activity of phytase family protein [Paracoccus albicereus]MCQ0969495.1 esterase-like activity of phytase family protein [Paracoccus albicereus]